LVSGSWGVGKTHLIQALLEENSETIKDYLYVSLYGVSSTEEISFAMLQAYFPLLGNRFGKMATRVGIAAMRALPASGVLDNFRLEDIRPGLQGKLIIFDDLERSELSIKDSLGYINSLVEHEGSKVIVLANEDELLTDNYYLKTKEKVIGQTLVVEASFAEAFSHFLKSVSNTVAKDALEDNKHIISEVFDTSELGNLRILHQTIFAFERVIDCLGENVAKKTDAVSDLVRIFFSLSLEARAGRLKSGSSISSNLLNSLPAENKQEDQDDVGPDLSRYQLATLPGSFFSDKVWENLLFNGLVMSEEIRTSYYDSIYFRNLKEQPCWRILWQHFTTDDDLVRSSLEEMEASFNQHVWTKTGEMLHVFG